MSVAAPVPSMEHDSERGGSEEDNRGVEPEERGQQPTGPAASVPHSRLSKLPLTRIKALMKTDPDVSLASQESVFIIAKATVKKQNNNNLIHYKSSKQPLLQVTDDFLTSVLFYDIIFIQV